MTADNDGRQRWPVCREKNNMTVDAQNNYIVIRNTTVYNAVDMRILFRE